MIEAPDQWHSATADEYAMLIQQARSAGAFEAKIGTFPPMMVVVMIAVAFVPPLFPLWSLGLYLLIRSTKGDALLVTDGEVIQATKRWSNYRIRRIRHDSLKDLQVRGGEWLDRLFGYNRIVGSREGQAFFVFDAENVQNADQVVAEWRRQAGR